MNSAVRELSRSVSSACGVPVAMNGLLERVTSIPHVVVMFSRQHH